VPPYVIFHDKVLVEVARLRPMDAAALRQVSGVGETKAESYGEDIARVISAFDQDL